MKIQRIFILFFSLCTLGVLAQAQQDSIKPKWQYQPNFLIGVDVLGGGVSAFSKQKKFQFFVASQIKGRYNGIVEGGFTKNVYDKNAYNATAEGYYAKLGAFYMMVTDTKNPKNGFYTGVKLAASIYAQEYQSVPTKGSNGQVFKTAFPKTNQSSYWAEATIGGRVQLFSSSFFIDVNAQPRYLVYTTKQDDIMPMIIPGFGKSSTKFNMGVAWSIAYYF